MCTHSDRFCVTLQQCFRCRKLRRGQRGDIQKRARVSRPAVHTTYELLLRRRACVRDAVPSFKPLIAVFSSTRGGAMLDPFSQSLTPASRGSAVVTGAAVTMLLWAIVCL